MFDFEKLIKNWSIEDVCVWVTTINLPNPKTVQLVQDKMVENEINGLVLLTYCVDTLMEDGFTRGVSVTICNAIDELRDGNVSKKKENVQARRTKDKQLKRNSIKGIGLPSLVEENHGPNNNELKTMKELVSADKVTVEGSLISNTGAIDRTIERKLSASFLGRTACKNISFASNQKRLDGLEMLLIRHGESEANVNRHIYAKKPDHAIQLSEKGIEEAKEAGRKVKQYFQEFYGETPPPNWLCRAWISPFKRTRETAQHVIENAGGWITDQREDIRLIEQQFGLFDGCDWSTGELDNLYHNELAYYNRCHMFGGRFYARVPMGESRFDVCNRVNMIFPDMANDAKQHGIKHVVVVSHGVTTRAFLMQYLRLSTEWFEESNNPTNGSIRVIRHNSDYGFYWDPRTAKKPEKLKLNESRVPIMKKIVDEIKRKPDLAYCSSEILDSIQPDPEIICDEEPDNDDDPTDCIINQPCAKGDNGGLRDTTKGTDLLLKQSLRQHHHHPMIPTGDSVDDYLLRGHIFPEGHPLHMPTAGSLAKSTDEEKDQLMAELSIKVASLSQQIHKLEEEQHKEKTPRLSQSTANASTWNSFL
jgi:broad specificity phosphatase PhoE